MRQKGGKKKKNTKPYWHPIPSVLCYYFGFFFSFSHNHMRQCLEIHCLPIENACNCLDIASFFYMY